MSAIPLLSLVLNTLDSWLAAASPLSLRTVAVDEQARPILVLICQFLAWAATLTASADSAMDASAEANLQAWHVRAMSHLLRLVVQSGSIQVALHACAALMAGDAKPLPPVSHLACSNLLHAFACLINLHLFSFFNQSAELDLASIIQPLNNLHPDRQLNGYLHEESADFLGFYEYFYPNEDRAALADKAAEALKKAQKASQNQQRHRRHHGRRRRGGYGDDVRLMCV